MTGRFGLDWAILSLSLANTILLIWLGTTVLLNAERRTWGGWLAAAGLLLGGVFFVSHTAILGYGFNVIGLGVDLWWAVGLMAVSILPFLWYIMMLWYSGFWTKPADGSQNQLVGRHRWLLLLVWVVLIGLLLLALFTWSGSASEPYPTRGLEEAILLNGQPVVLVVYPVYVLVSLALSLDALHHPGPSQRRMAELARKRARPWLIAATSALLLVSLAVVAVFAWLYRFLGNFNLLVEEIVPLGWFDLLIEGLILLAVAFLGQAVVSYEIFTGQTLPRQGFVRQWRRAVLLAIGYGVLIGFTFSTNLRPIYGVLISALLMTFFFAMLSWRTVSERQRAFASLRPFVISQRFYDQLLAPSDLQAYATEEQMPFDALCQDVLNTRLAFLAALGPLAPLAGSPLKFSVTQEDEKAKLPDLADLPRLLPEFSPDASIFRVEKEIAVGIEWAVPLWSQRGLVGVLLLGDKQDGGIFAQEEIEIAQAVGERLVDAKASSEIGQRLMSLQRQRLAETQVLDQRSRRILHDEVLQQLHAAILNIDKTAAKSELDLGDAQAMLTDIHAQISALLRSMPSTSFPQISQLGLVGALRKLVTEEMYDAFDSVTWQVSPEDEREAARLSPLELEVFYFAARELIRNAAMHGRSSDEKKPLNLSVALNPGAGLGLVIEDDGLGILSTRRDQMNGGQGLALHSTMMAVIGGKLEIESEPGAFTRAILSLP